jgi:ABC-type lipoprotein export system ATPase subunit
VKPPVLEISGVVKDYRGLRPLRIERFVLQAEEHVAIAGVDRVSAEVLVNLLTGAVLPDAGTITIFGRPTSDITESAEWLSFVDRFGIVTGRAVLLEELSALQNLAVPFSLDIEPLSGALREQAWTAGREAGLDETQLAQPVSALGPGARLRIRVARAVAHNPSLVILEHPTADLPRDQVAPIAREIRALLERRGVAALTLTGDRDFADTVAPSVMSLQAATGRVLENRRGWFGSGRR